MSLTIKPVQGRRDLARFLKLPFRIYKDTPNWVAPLFTQERARFNSSKNPFFDHSEVQGLLAFDGRRGVGRIAAIRNGAHNDYHKDRVGFFGHFESIDSQEVASALLDAAAGWLRERGMDTMRGPCNFSVNESCGLLIEGFECPPYIMMPYNPEYYAELLEAWGLGKVMDLYSYHMKADQPVPARVRRIAERARRKEGVEVRGLRMDRFWQEIERVKVIYNEAWSENWGAVPMSDREFEHLAKMFKRIVAAELVLIAEVNSEPVAFSMALPNINEALAKIRGRLDPIGLVKLLYYSRRVTTARHLILGVRAAYRRRGLEAILYIETFKRAQRLGYREGEVGWTLETNALVNRAIEVLGGRRVKTYRLYEKALV
jgi:GNAT superfamily N-acetyltransferase